MCALSTRSSLWSHLQQRAAGESPAGGQASDPDTEGEAQHGQSVTLLAKISLNVVINFAYVVHSTLSAFK